MTPATFLRAAPRGMLITVIIAFALLNGLGVWQLYRLQWKEGLIADMARTESQPPLPVDVLLAQGKPDWRSAALPQCRILPDHLINMHSEVAGEPGYRVLTACPLPQGNMLVDLGFATDRLVLKAPVDVQPIGRLRPADKPSAFAPVNRPADNDWYTRSTVEAGAKFGMALRSDYFLVTDIAQSHLDIPGLQQGPLTAPLPNRHFEYALTWFGLAWCMIGIFIAFVFQQTKASKQT